MSTSAPILPATDDAIAQAAAHLRAGRLVAFPTETVYGLGGDATDDHAVAAIFAAKGRPSFNPLISHLPDLDAARKLAIFTPLAERLAANFWPGPLTLVLRRRPDCPVSHLACAGLDTIALRVPAHPVATRLLRATGRPVVAPSANPSGKVSPTQAQHVRNLLGDRLALVLDGGACAIGVESSVVDATGDRPVLLRPGGVTLEALEQAVGPVTLPEHDPDAPTSPGQLASHYAPALPVRLNATNAAAGEALLGFGPTDGTEALNLSRAGDLQEAAANLFAMLRALDRPGLSGIAIMPIPETGLGRAINDRLRRAAGPR
ncbi:MAG: threonylcarbamoyl-AMP synthase [Alphaproteobacteria bacterium]|nr:threonylcarbamoyl-AMP synthase [Alphaproteobacteria bacterium]MBU0798668.1 threonylcarbamoyl-AMP synthase [Alphaproteobacteria bacterium]MBU0885931.1 threonylcarbamoyl-AMP synthase [Alphaproteobacteria bacterium]MBU1811920.1 threonylcarbamoyl-AMP synthase [Alphaproteobacteria bacterium]